MHAIIQKLFEKRGIKDVSQLSPEEKKDYEQWELTLADSEVTVDKILSFCERQVKAIELVWRDREKTQAQKSELIPYHTVYSAIREIITAPQAQRESLEKYLLTLLRE